MAKQIDELKNRLHTALAKRGMKPIELAEKTDIPKASISQYMSGYAKPNGDRVYLISNVLKINEAWLLGYDVPMERDNGISLPPPGITGDYTTFPIIGDIAAGYDHIAGEDWEGDTAEIPNSYLKGHSPEEFFVLRVTGDSMYPLFHDGDKVLILRQTAVKCSGDIGAVIYDDEIATLKKVEFSKGEDWLRLVPINPNIPPIMIEGERLEHCRILGVPKLLLRDFI